MKIPVPKIQDFMILYGADVGKSTKNVTQTVTSVEIWEITSVKLFLPKSVYSGNY